jgi:type I restriction enzyme, S subunit
MWIERPLSELASIISGGTPSREVPAYWDGDIPWVTPSDITACGTNVLSTTKEKISRRGLAGSAARLLPAQSILLTSRATVGEARMASVPVCTNQGFKALSANASVDPWFLFYQVQRSRGLFERYAAGSTFLEIGKRDTEKIPILHPTSVDQQRSIAAILTTLDNAIEATEALINKHQQIKAGLMHDLFTRGVLLEGGLRPLMSDAPHLYRDGPLGVLPVEWEAAKAGSLCSLITKGTTPASIDMWEGADGIRFLRVDNLTFDGKLSFDASEFRISARTHASTLARSRCIVGDVLMNIVGPPLGKVGMVSIDSGSININQAISVFRPTDRLLSRYLLLWLTTDTAKRWILQRAKQTSGQVNVTLAMCQALPVPLPSLEEQARIVDSISASDDSLLVLTTRLAKLRAQKLGLMQDLLTGKVSVQSTAAIPA